MTRHQLTDKEWNCIADLFPTPAQTGRPPRDRRTIVDAILWIARTGSPWRDLPEEYQPWATVWGLFDKWNADGTLNEILRRLRAMRFDAGKIDQKLWCVDGTIVRAARCAAGGGEKNVPEEPVDHALGRSRGGFSTKIHILCDGKGHPLHFHLTPGQDHESTTLVPLLNGADAEVLNSEGKLVAWPVALARDKAYRADWIDECLLELEITPVIPSKDNEDRGARSIVFNKKKYQRRNIIERLIDWLKESRRILTRFEKTAKNFAGMLTIAFIHRYLRLLCK